MAGLLVYTATSDADGTLGGLQRQGESARILRSAVAAIKAMEWCSSDPFAYRACCLPVTNIPFRPAMHASLYRKLPARLSTGFSTGRHLSDYPKSQTQAIFPRLFRRPSMAFMWPKKLTHEVLSNVLRSTECRVFNKFEKELDDSFTVFLFPVRGSGLNQTGKRLMASVILSLLIPILACSP